MPAQGRVGDNALVPIDVHGKPCCPHVCVGPGTSGSPNVNVNNQPALRVSDPGMHAACCDSNSWKAAQGSSTVSINNLPAHRVGDQTTHCGGIGMLILGSPNVIVGGAPTASDSAGTCTCGKPAEPPSTWWKPWTWEDKEWREKWANRLDLVSTGLGYAATAAEIGAAVLAATGVGAPVAAVLVAAVPILKGASMVTGIAKDTLEGHPVLGVLKAGAGLALGELKLGDKLFEAIPDGIKSKVVDKLGGKVAEAVLGKLIPAIADKVQDKILDKIEEGIVKIEEHFEKKEAPKIPCATCCSASASAEAPPPETPPPAETKPADPPPADGEAPSTWYKPWTWSKEQWISRLKHTSTGLSVASTGLAVAGVVTAATVAGAPATPFLEAGAYVANVGSVATGFAADVLEGHPWKGLAKAAVGLLPLGKWAGKLAGKAYNALPSSVKSKVAGAALGAFMEAKLLAPKLTDKVIALCTTCGASKLTQKVAGVLEKIAPRMKNETVEIAETAANKLLLSKTAKAIMGEKFIVEAGTKVAERAADLIIDLGKDLAKDKIKELIFPEKKEPTKPAAGTTQSPPPSAAAPPPG
jgi:uncharacterized Zn-binding protein involved in type VI secretion